MEFRLTSDAKDPGIKLFLATRKQFILSIVLILTGAGLIFFALIPQIQQTLALRQKLETEQGQLEKIEAKLEQLSQVRLTQEFSQKQVVEDALPSEKPLLQTLNSLNNVLRSSRVEITNLKLSPGQIGSGSATLSIGKGATASLDLEYSINGNFANVQDFLENIEKMSPFTTITKLSLSTPQETQKEETVRASLETKTYFFTQTVAQTLTAPLPSLGAKEKEILTALASFEPDTLPEQTQILDGGLERFFTTEELNFGFGASSQSTQNLPATPGTQPTL